MSPRMRSPAYPPEMRKTDLGRKIYRCWQRLIQTDHAPEFDSYPDFYRFAITHGGDTMDFRMIRVDNSLPYDQENTLFVPPKNKDAVEDPEPHGERAEMQDSIDRWDALIGSIRKDLGLPPLEGSHGEL